MLSFFGDEYDFSCDINIKLLKYCKKKSQCGVYYILAIKEKEFFFQKSF